MDFSKNETQMAQKHLKECSISLVMREMLIKTALIFHFTVDIMAKINKTNAVHARKLKHLFLAGGSKN